MARWPANINDLFFTVQGEGANMGRRALFVRMPFCNLTCSWCDTTFNTFARYSQADFLLFVDQEPTCKFAVLTGGEPTMNKHLPLIIEALKGRGYELAVESNGMFPVPKGIDFVTLSPKRDATPTPYWVDERAWAAADEFKYVVDDDFDFDLLKRHNVQDGRRYSLSPEATHMERNVERILEFMGRFPSSKGGWRLNLQTHKWIGVK